MGMRSSEQGWLSKNSMCWKEENQIQEKKKLRIANLTMCGGIGKRNIRWHIGSLPTAEGKLMTRNTRDGMPLLSQLLQDALVVIKQLL